MSISVEHQLCAHPCGGVQSTNTLMSTSHVSNPMTDAAGTIDKFTVSERMQDMHANTI